MPQERRLFGVLVKTWEELTPEERARHLKVVGGDEAKARQRFMTMTDQRAQIDAVGRNRYPWFEEAVENLIGRPKR